MPTKTFRYTSYLVAILQKIIGSNFSVTGLENVPKDHPVMFVSNHFTRIETFIVPYLINKYTKRQVRSLAASVLFSGLLGRFLKNLGTISTQDPNRNKIIISDLVHNNYDWLIYPEGGMVKNKNIVKDRLYISQTNTKTAPVRTGSAVLAIKSQLYRDDIVKAKKSSNIDLLKQIEKGYGCVYEESLNEYSTHIVPLTVSYYPIRPGSNRLESFTKKRISDIPSSISEELQIEGNLLSHSNINLHFGKAINLKDYTRLKKSLIYNIPIIKNETKTNIITKYFKHSLTTEFMTMIYKNLSINIDHIFSATIRFASHRDQTMSILKLKRIIFISAYLIKKVDRFRVGSSLSNENLIDIFNDEKHKGFESIMNLAKDLGEVIFVEDDVIKINKDNLYREEDFHSSRINNTLQVIFNEFSILDYASSIVKRTAAIKDENLKKKTRDILIKLDNEKYKKDYKRYYHKKLSKPFGFGKPFLGSPSFLNKEVNKKYSILLCHGYKSCPREMSNLSDFLNRHGFYTYCVRLAGHGTNPENIKDVSWQDWDHSLKTGYAVLKNITDKVIIIGFSTGGLLTLLNASRKSKNVPAIVAINPAIRLRDIRSNFASTIDRWNSLLNTFNISMGSIEYVESSPENPKTNYVRNYLKGVVELKKLMDECDKSLSKISTTTLLIQASGDPVVNPEGANLIYHKIASKEKILFEPDFDNHVIVNGNREEEVFDIILDFFRRKNFF